MRMIAIGSLVLAFICCLGVVWFFIDAFVLADVDNVWQQVAAGTAATTLAAFALVLVAVAALIVLENVRSEVGRFRDAVTWEFHRRASGK
jgi:hypothetical protein